LRLASYFENRASSFVVEHDLLESARLSCAFVFVVLASGEISQIWDTSLERLV
jgi:hypothetical protein